MNFIGESNYSTLIIGLLFMGAVFLIAYIRNVEARRIRKLFREGEILLSSFGVQYYGIESEPGNPLRSTGSLVLTNDGIYYHAKFSQKKLQIPGDNISSITAVDTFKGKNMYMKIVSVNFVNEKGERDRAGFRIPYPERWSQAINKIFCK
ncbi:MAG: hypothetical protein KAQ69_06875 [Spirochaetales bacterium]|nr:hypothetical protein [Spirochaetales bacterium]